MKKQLFEKLTKLQKVDSVSGHEQPIVRCLRVKVEPLVDEIKVDALGNLIAIKRGRHSKPSLMISAHTDEIGAMVKSVEANGFLRFSKIGGTIDSLLIGRKVRLNGHLGVIGVKAGHIQKPEEQNRIIGSIDMYVDMGVDSEAEIEAMGIHIGDPIVYDSEMSYFHNTDRVCGKALDNRIGCAILWQMLEDLKDKTIDGDLYAVFSSQEEVGLRGAKTAAYSINPDYAIVLDTVPSGDTPETNTRKELNIKIGSGPMVPLYSQHATYGNLIHPVMKKILLETAEAHEIPIQPALFDGGTSEISAVYLEREGIVTGAVTIPRRYSHSPVEMMDINDALNSYRLLMAIIDEMGNHQSIGFLDD
jgi:endoglucanase